MSTLSAVPARLLLMPHAKHLHAIDAVRAMLHAVARPEWLRYPPDLNSILEDAAMAREMRRL